MVGLAFCISELPDADRRECAKIVAGLGGVCLLEAGFVPASSFSGVRPGYSYKTGEEGLGYYRDSSSSSTSAPASVGEWPTAGPADKVTHRVRRDDCAAGAADGVGRCHRPRLDHGGELATRAGQRAVRPEVRCADGEEPDERETGGCRNLPRQVEIFAWRVWPAPGELIYRELHIGLAGAYPDVAEQDVPERDRHAAAGSGKRVHRGARWPCQQLHLPG